MFKKILIANRGEIAIRVIRACRELDIATVAVFSEADRAALHVRVADEAFCIGPAPARESYLRIDKILEVAKATGVDAIHPGYGFLSENAEFAEACAASGITFIGPNPKAIRVMGNKTTSRVAVAEMGVPLVPGMKENLRDEDHAVEWAEKIGFPLMMKAAAGGGGKGMRKVFKMEEVRSAYRSAVGEAIAAFGDDAVYMERYVEQPRHIEFQVLGDKHGNIVYFPERDCSIQRRHQKVVEESPSVLVDEDMRRRMGEAAVQAARAVDYDSAGTVEFIVSGATKEFFFLEMNTRLQGHAIECRIYAEDPDNHFLPTPGRITGLRVPGGPWVRDESGMYEGLDVPIFYDPMLSKLVVWGSTRDRAITRMKRALGEYSVKGIKTTFPFHARVMEDPAFLEGIYDTTFIDTQFQPKDEQRVRPYEDVAIVAAALKAHLRDKDKAQHLMGGHQEGGEYSAWKQSGRVRR